VTNATVQVLAAGACLVLVVVFLIAQHIGRRNPPGSDVGVDIVDCGMVEDELSQVLHCAGAHDMRATPLGDGRWLHECVRCHLEWWITTKAEAS